MPASALATAISICGIDEAGRGALAGPVSAGACILPARKRFPVLIGDSKKMTPEERSASYEWLVRECVFGAGMVDAATVDSIGILAATELAMQEAVRQVANVRPDLYLLVDGRDAFWFDHPHSSVIRGDATERCIGAASIIAKVTRDRHMVSLHAKFPHYGFDQHKGYGTPEHYAAIAKYGRCTVHRKTFQTNIALFPKA